MKFTAGYTPNPTKNVSEHRILAETFQFPDLTYDSVSY